VVPTGLGLVGVTNILSTTPLNPCGLNPFFDSFSSVVSVELAGFRPIQIYMPSWTRSDVGHALVCFFGSNLLNFTLVKPQLMKVTFGRVFSGFYDQGPQSVDAVYIDVGPATQQHRDDKVFLGNSFRVQLFPILPLPLWHLLLNDRASPTFLPPGIPIDQAVSHFVPVTVNFAGHLRNDLNPLALKPYYLGFDGIPGPNQAINAGLVDLRPSIGDHGIIVSIWFRRSDPTPLVQSPPMVLLVVQAPNQTVTLISIYIEYTSNVTAVVGLQWTVEKGTNFTRYARTKFFLQNADRLTQGGWHYIAIHQDLLDLSLRKCFWDNVLLPSLSDSYLTTTSDGTSWEEDASFKKIDDAIPLIFGSLLIGASYIDNNITNFPFKGDIGPIGISSVRNFEEAFVMYQFSNDNALWIWGGGGIPESGGLLGGQEKECRSIVTGAVVTCTPDGVPYGKSLAAGNETLLFRPMRFGHIPAGNLLWTILLLLPDTELYGRTQIFPMSSFRNASVNPPQEKFGIWFCKSADNVLNYVVVVTPTTPVPANATSCDVFRAGIVGDSISFVTGPIDSFKMLALLIFVSDSGQTVRVFRNGVPLARVGSSTSWLVTLPLFSTGFLEETEVVMGGTIGSPNTTFKGLFGYAGIFGRLADMSPVDASFIESTIRAVYFVREIECLPGYFGKNCSPCFCDAGICNDTITGDGHCKKNTTCLHSLTWTTDCFECLCLNGKCSNGTNGTGYCTECASSEYYGPTCIPCACTTGFCDGGVDGDGECHVLSTGQIIGIAIGGFFGLLLIPLLVWFYFRFVRTPLKKDFLPPDIWRFYQEAMTIGPFQHLWVADLDPSFMRKKLLPGTSEHTQFKGLWDNLSQDGSLKTDGVYGILNPALVGAFQTHAKLQQQRMEKDVALFGRQKWKQLEGADQKQWVYDQGFVDWKNRFPEAQVGTTILPCLHGTDGAVAQKILWGE